MRLVFEWDEAKARANRRKHQVDFEEARTVFSDPFLFSFSDEHHSDSEDRLVSIGISANSRMLLVIHTEHELNGTQVVIRIISARKATALERE